jgi:hypothetical protein
VAAATVTTAAVATACSRNDLATRRSQDRQAVSSPATGSGSSAARQPRREAASASRTAARCWAGARASETTTVTSPCVPRQASADKPSGIRTWSTRIMTLPGPDE